MSTTSLVYQVLKCLNDKAIPYCLLRDGEDIDQFRSGGEIDILVADTHFATLRRQLHELQFVQLATLGYSPHTFFIAYDSHGDCWLKLDVVTKIAFGRPIQSLSTSLSVNCLGNRRFAGLAYVPSPEDELVSLLLHCVLDKAHISPARARRLASLRLQVTDEHYITSLLATHWSIDLTWQRLAAIIDNSDFVHLLEARQTVASRLANRGPWRTHARSLCGRMLRKLSRLAPFYRPWSFTVAFLAPDGAGKSTLVNTLVDTAYIPVRSIYMGLYQGRAASRRIVMPGVGMMNALFKQWSRCCAASYHTIMGRLVLFDRYTYDALLPPRRRPSLLQRLRRWLLAHSCPSPDLVFLLDAPGQLLFKRKAEHSEATLENQRQAYLEMRSSVPNMIVVDAAQDSDQVRRKVLTLIWKHVVDHNARRCANDSRVGDVGARHCGSNCGEGLAGDEDSLYDVTVSEDHRNIHIVRDACSGTTRSTH